MDGEWAKQDTITIVLAGCTSAARALKSDWDTLCDIFDEACQWWAARGRTFHVLLC
ncbi:MAG: barstar family protein [Casimicrobiaceae bacterium]